jgi:hypothetical protein
VYIWFLLAVVLAFLAQLATLAVKDGNLWAVVLALPLVAGASAATVQAVLVGISGFTGPLP